MSNINSAETVTGKSGPLVCPKGLEIFPAGHKTCPYHGVALEEQTADGIVGRKLDNRYEVQEVISWGGWACIYKAQDTEFNRPVAIKVLFQHLSQDDEALARFRREAKAAAALSHPNVAQLFDSGVLDGGQPYLVFEYVKGLTLGERIEMLGPLTAEQAVMVFIQICDALQATHELGIIHRDIKPGNIMFTQNEAGDIKAKLVDFGLARATADSAVDMGDNLTRTGETLGSPAYMSPEQCMGEPLDIRSDVYSLGCTIYESVTGNTPFTGTTIFEFMEKHTEHEPVTPQVKSSNANFAFNVSHVILQTLQKDPAVRPQSMRQLKEQLQSCLWAMEGYSAQKFGNKASLTASIITKRVPDLMPEIEAQAPVPQTVSSINRAAQPPLSKSRRWGGVWSSLLAPAAMIVTLVALLGCLVLANPFNMNGGKLPPQVTKKPKPTAAKKPNKRKQSGRRPSKARSND